MKPPSRPYGRPVRRVAIWAAVALATLLVGATYLHIVNAQAGCLLRSCTFFPVFFVPPWPTPTATHTATATPTTSPYLFNDEFNGTSLDTAKWTVPDEEGDTSNNEQECYKPANVTVSGGSLILTSKALSAPAACKNHNQGTTNYSYTSGLAQWRTFTLLYGVVEFRAKTPATSGQWPAIWLLGASCQSSSFPVINNLGCQWPADSLSSAEIDILEQFGSPSQNNMMIHNGSNPGDDSFHNGCYLNLSYNTSAGFHTYKLIWEPGKATWQIDGVTLCTSTSHVPAHPMFLRINLAVGGGGGVIDKNGFPQTLQVDYVRVTALP